MLSLLAAAGRADDTVILSDGSRVRGSIVSLAPDSVEIESRSGIEKLGITEVQEVMLDGEPESLASARTLLAPVQEAARAHASHPQYHADVRRYLQLVFGLSADALQSYRNAKLAAGAVDFVDQDALMLHALRTRPEVRAALAEELDLVLVDEFQDTSPLQLALFVELAQLARRSVWVGDPKQAIYGFRGTDATLVAQVLQALPQWGGRVGEALSTSRAGPPRRWCR
jgi:ATP-dependent exoDNAse (exonuclease V) beta subunit